MDEPIYTNTIVQIDQFTEHSNKVYIEIDSLNTTINCHFEYGISI